MVPLACYPINQGHGLEFLGASITKIMKLQESNQLPILGQGIGLSRLALAQGLNQHLIATRLKDHPIGLVATNGLSLADQ